MWFILHFIRSVCALMAMLLRIHGYDWGGDVVPSLETCETICESKLLEDRSEVDLGEVSLVECLPLLSVTDLL